MNIHSNVPFPREAIRWKDGQWALFVNHQDNGVQPEETAGSRYTADFTVTKELSAIAAIEAFTRQLQDPQLDQAVIDNAEVTGVPAIDVTAEYTTKAPVTIFPPLPASGPLKKGEIYSYGGGAVMVVQDHQRTIYTPEETPALFSFYREDPEGAAWIPGEDVALNATRTFGGKTWKCIQAHKTLEGWEPDITPALWQEVKEQGETIPVWVQPTGGHDAYSIGAKVHYPTITDPVYESLINGNVWSPVAYPAGWRQL